MAVFDPEIAALVDTLTEAYGEAWRRVVKEAAAIVDDPRAFRRRARLAEIQAAIEGALDTVDQQAALWLNESLPQVYLVGSGSTGDATRDAALILANRDAITKLATDSYDSLLSATQFIRDSTKKLIRDAVRKEVTSGVIEGQTHVVTASDLAAELRAQGIYAIRYANGARVGLEQYAGMVVRTLAGQAYNLGTLRGAAGDGVEFFEVFDGPDCGWTSHDDDDLADGSIRSKADCERYPLAHPNCRRAFGPRPDLNGTTPPAYAPTVTPTQTQAQIRSDLQLGISYGAQKAPGTTTEGRVQNILSQRQARIDRRAARVAGVR